MENLETWCKGLQRKFITANGVKTAIFVAPENACQSDISGEPGAKPNKNQSISLLIHGINGSHYGLIELARHAKNSQIILVDLPGHGDSETPVWHDLANLRKWFSEVYDAIWREFSSPQQVVAHSFGCYAITDDKLPPAAKISLICPVPTSRLFYKLFASAMRLAVSSKALLRVYDYLPFSVWRGMTLINNKTVANRAHVRFIAAHDRQTTLTQRRYQTKLLDIMDEKNIFASVRPALVIHGRADKTARERSGAALQRVFPNSKIASVSGSHLATTENAREIAEILHL